MPKMAGLSDFGRWAAVVLTALSLGACASLGDEPFTASGADTGKPEVAVAAAAPTASAPADLGGGAATLPPNATFDVAVDDPFEDFNRVIFHINDSVDTLVVVPVAEVYRGVVPQHARDGIRNAFANLASPVTFANDMFQGEWERAHITFHRFVINTTVGVAGFHDAAATLYGLEPHFEDFDQTLALHGVESGPYLVLPLIGPATPRHVVGRVVDSFAHPLTWALGGEPFLVAAAPRAAEATSVRADLLDSLGEIRRSSPDYYAAVRSLYRQSRQSEIGNGQTGGGGAGDAPALNDDLDLVFD
jgi:phospholipid-binding lipoprotein MlaA